MTKFKFKKFTVSTLVLIFATNSWIGINSIWVELPLLVQTLPEQWYLGSYLSVIVQLANVGPLVYGFLNWYKPKFVTPVSAVFVILNVGALAMVLIACLWTKVTFIFGSYHSVALMVLAFFLSMTNCSSNVISLPYIGKFQDSFITPYFVGMGISGLLPSLLALAQGAGSVRCINDTDSNTTSVIAVNLAPNFDASTFFFITFGFMVLAFFSFVALNYWQGAQQFVEREKEAKTNSESFKKYEISKTKLTFLFLLNVVVCALMDSVLNSIQSFTGMPYGIKAYHLAVVCGGISNPVGCLTSYFFQIRRTVAYLLINVVSFAFCGYLLYLALMSPNPPLKDNTSGIAIMVLSWCVVMALFGFTRTCIANNLRQSGGERYLFWCGVFTQLGSFLGAALIFPLANVLQVFKSAPNC